MLARAMKEWDRRPLERSGFDSSAGDCLAFKYMRDVRRRRGERSLLFVGGPVARSGACTWHVHTPCPACCFLQLSG